MSLLNAARRVTAVASAIVFLAHPCATQAGELPAGWSHQDVGEVSVKGDAGSSEGTYTISGTLDIWGKADGFHFVHRPLDGDGQVVARVTAVQNTNGHAKAGVMIRESLAADSRHATMVLTAVDGTQFLKRVETGGLTTSTPLGKGRKVLPYWVKLVRSGATFTAYESPDGNDWVKAGSIDMPMGRRVLIGLVVSSHQKDVTNTSTLDHVSVETGAP
jgi:hypothetical protein